MDDLHDISEDETAMTQDDSCVVDIRTTIKLKELTSKVITDIMKDRYHNNMAIRDIKTKYNISQRTWSELNKRYSKAFIETFGSKKNVGISVDDMLAYWQQTN